MTAAVSIKSANLKNVFYKREKENEMNDKYFIENNKQNLLNS